MSISMRRMPKKVSAGPTGAEQITVRVDRSLIDRAEGLIAFVGESKALPAVRADVFREAILIGLKALEKDRDKKK